MFDQLSSDDVLVGLPVPPVVLLGPVPDGLHLGKVRELVQGRFTRLAALQDQSPVSLMKSRECHREGLTWKQIIKCI